MKKRIDWIDITKFICIFCVIIDHVDGCDQRIIYFFSPFFLSCFFFVSGYCYNNNRSFSLHIKKKAKSLLVPWFIYSNFNILLSHVYSYYGHDSLTAELAKNLLQIRGYGDYLWFVACLFISYIPFYFIIKTYDKQKSVGKIFIILFVFAIAMACSLLREYMVVNNIVHIWKKVNFIWHGEYVFEAMFYMIIGYGFKEIENEYDNKMQLNIFVLLFYVYLLYFGKAFYSNTIWLSFITNAMLSILGISLITCLSKIIKTTPYISFVGQNTLLYFSLHNKAKTFLIIIVELFCPNFSSLINANILMNLFFVCIFAFIITLVLIPPIMLINRYLPWTIGRNKEKICD